ncbi:amidase [Rugamonas apoptosis]|uniref:Amidase n=1 Tax=Rugamonas apoptosis TaxID=2758570 RepID=A0A7W2F8G8_9BURK|nr:amidase [Rugamonas apoptosis]MBA5687053.1 amidase [Rugamonas apoptosis]
MSKSHPSDELCHLSATEALRLFRSHDLSPVELLQACQARADRLEPQLNCFSAQRRDAALAAAREAEQTYARRSGSPRPLEGLPTALKNEHTLIGWTTTKGSWLVGDTPDTVNAPITQRLLDAGAVIHAQTNVPEFYMAGFTRSARHGVTRNPWNPAMTPGGSSGGSGAALAAGLATLASGSDIGGSIRIPASYCGVVGLKPSYGRVPVTPIAYALNTMNHIGPMARTVADCALMFNAINGPHNADPAAISPRLELPLAFEPVRGMRIALSYDLGYCQVHPEVRTALDEVVLALRTQGAVVEEVALGWGSWVAEALDHRLGFETGREFAARILNQERETSDYIRAFAAAGLQVTGEQYLASQTAIGRMYDTMAGVMDRFDALICPTMAGTGSAAEGQADSTALLHQDAMTYPFNLLSRHPVLNVPSGVASNGVPTGVQIVGRPYDETTAFRVGAALERALWQDCRPALAAIDHQGAH